MNRVITKLTYSTRVKLSVPYETNEIKHQRTPSRFWENQENIINFLSKIKEKYNLNTPEEVNKITREHIRSNGGSRLFSKYSMYDLKCLACPEGKSIFTNPPQPSGYWEKEENVVEFLSKIKEKYNLNTPEDWNSITKKQIQSNGGNSLLTKYTIFDLKCLACPEGKLKFNATRQVAGYWENGENILLFLSKIKEKYNLNTPEDWNSITHKHILSNGGGRLFSKYSMYELKCLACPEGKSIFNKPNQPSGYWENKENVVEFLSNIKEKYNLITPEDWNSITRDQIQSNGGGTLLSKYTIYELKCLACPEGKSKFNIPKQVVGYWEKEENVLQFLSKIKEKYNLNTLEDWNSISQYQIQSNGGRALLSKYSMYDLKCLACPEGKSIFTNPPQPSGYWEKEENVLQFFSKIKEKYNLNTPEDWNTITNKQIQSNGGTALLSKYSLFELKCIACPEGKSKFNNPKQVVGYWEKEENALQFLSKIKEKYNLNTPEDWNSITREHILDNGGRTLFLKYSMYELKCLACPEGKSIFTNPPQPSGYWEKEENILQFLAKIKEKYNLNTPEDWKRISRQQITSDGGWGLFNNKNYLKVKLPFETSNNTTKYIPFSKLISKAVHKRSSQRWLFLQIQKLFPGEEIVEDYFHSEISRISGFNVQFDIFMMNKNIAIEYHGIQHYEDNPTAFSNLETYQYRDLEKEMLCKEHNIQLIVIPYWWDNELDSLRTFLNSKIKF